MPLSCAAARSCSPLHAGSACPTLPVHSVATNKPCAMPSMLSTRRDRTLCKPVRGVRIAYGRPLQKSMPRRSKRSCTQSTGFWQVDRPLDVRVGRGGLCRVRLDHHPGQCRDHSPDALAFEDQLEACQTLDHQPRPAIPSKKNARDRLIAWASLQPLWAIGFLDEVWWSRFALPRMHAWQSEDQPVRLVEQSWQKGDPDPKAMACYGVLWQEGTPDDPVRDQMWLRFVTGRPVSD